MGDRERIMTPNKKKWYETVKADLAKTRDELQAGVEVCDELIAYIEKKIDMAAPYGGESVREENNASGK